MVPSRRHRGDVSKSMIYLNFQHVDCVDASEAIQQSFTFLFQEGVRL